MLNVIVVGVLLFAVIKTGFCIECYSCLSRDNPDCENPEKHRLEKVKCGMQGMTDTKKYAESLNPDFSKIFEFQIHEPAIPLNCLKQVTKVQGQEIILRGCQLPKDDRLDVCKKVFEVDKTELISVKHCSLCDTDGCNAGRKLATSWLMVPLLLASVCKYSMS